jgi:unconventional prefoldin RPB5 interactor 1
VRGDFKDQILYFAMTQLMKDSFLDLERHRQLLEANIEKLRKALYHWQVWEAEYEGLKEEICAHKPFPSQEQLVSIGKAYDGELVTKAEAEDILGIKIPRSAEQVVNILERRIDYVGQNVQSVQKQLQAAEHKLAAATVISTLDVRNEEGLPLMEIVEELDEDGNVISSRTSTPGSARGQLLEVLEKAGVKDLPGLEQTREPRTEVNNEDSKAVENHLQTPLEPMPSHAPGKSVRFTEDTKAGPEVKKSKTAQRVEKILNLAKQQEATSADKPITPANESAEDAALRKEMLEYSMSEIGPIVAELNLEEGSDLTDGEYDDEDASDIEYDDDDRDEDEHGRSTRRIVDDELRQKMIELEERLGIRKAENAELKPAVSSVDEGMGYIRVKMEDEDMPTNEGTKEKKAVRFAEGLDFPPSSNTAPLSTANKLSPAPRTSPIGDIVERAPPNRESDTGKATPPQKTPRFKSSRFEREYTPVSTPIPSLNSGTISPSQTRTAPTPPSGTPLAVELVERPTSSLPPLEPDELDSTLLKQEVATEYYQVRNRLISRQGGFTRDKEEEERRTGRVEYEEEEGGPKRVSRFKAARLARS